MATADDTAATMPQRFTSFHTCADRLEVSGKHAVTSAPVALLDTEAPLPALAIFMSSRARRLYRTINMLVPASLTDVDATELIDVLHPMAEEVQQIAEVIERHFLAQVQAGEPTNGQGVSHG